MNTPCVLPQASHKDFTVIHTNGLHYVTIDFCRCEHHVSNRLQLLRSEWFPVTVHQPQTCATFRMLEVFHTITLAGKLSAHEYYKVLEYMTDNMELNVPKVGPLRYFTHLTSHL